jgi:hypothetical protein
MRTLSFLVAGACLAGCTSSSIDPAQLNGTWTGTQSNGKTFRYTFSGSTFQYGGMHDGTFVQMIDGTFAVQGERLTFDASLTLEDGSQTRARMTFDAHLASSGLCIGGYRAEGSELFDNGGWRTETTTQAFDSNGTLIGAPQTSFEEIVTYRDNTYFKDSGGDSGESGTWSQQGDTITFASTPWGGVSAVRSFVLVDDVLCDPLYSR